MNKENLKQEKKEVAMVECPYCNKPIEAPAKADVIFVCPHCNKELITYDKTAEPEQSRKMETKKKRIDSKTEKLILKWSCIVAFIGLLCYFSFVSMHGKDPSKSNGSKTENYVNRKGPSKTKAMAGVKTYLKRYCLKDPDSYQGISWEAFGIYNQENNTYFALHKYRAKNSFGGYVVEEKLFVLDSDGNVIKVVDDVNEIINGY